MIPGRKQKHALRRGLLLAVLLLAQGLALAHDTSHVGVSDFADCVVCSLHSGLEGAVAVATWVVPECREEAVLHVRGTEAFRAGFTTHRQARAPPVNR